MSHELLTALRERTRALHQELDHHPLMALLLQPQVEASAYANTLAWMHPLQAELEQYIVSCAEHLPKDMPLAERLPALEADLHELGFAAEKLPAQVTFGIGRSQGALAGVLYVLNGARLGSAHIARRLQHTSPQLPCHYFATADGSQHWPLTLQFLETIAAHEYHDCEQAATAVFKGYIDVLNIALEAND